MAEALFDVRLERVVSRYPDRGVGLGLTRVSNVRNSQVDIATLRRELHRLGRLAIGCGQHQRARVK